MSVVVRFADRLRSLGAFLEDEILGIVTGYNALIGREHNLATGGHTDITADSVTSSGQRWVLGPWLLDTVGNTAANAVIRPPQITANQNNYAPVGLDTAIGLDVTSDADRNITGLRRAAHQKRLLFIGNRGTKILSLIHQSVNSNATNRFSIDSNQDYFLGPNQYVWLYYDTDSERWRTIGQNQAVYVDAYLPTSSQVLTTATFTKIQFSAENYDSHSLFDSTTNYRFTAPTKGLYWVHSSLMFQPNGTATATLRTEIYVNGVSRSSVITGAQTNQVFVSVPHSRLVSLAAGDYIEIYGYQDSGANMNVFRATESTFLSIFRYH